MATILIVDDLSANRALLGTILHHEGHRLLEATNGFQALASARAELPDLVITDVLMPVMDGFELVKQLRQDPTTREIPVVFATAHYGQREAKALALSSGVTFVLTKPLQYADVLRVVGRALSGESESGPPPDGPPLVREFDREHLGLLTDQLSEKAADLRSANARLRAVINVGLELASERDGEVLLRNVCEAARELFGATYVTLGIVDLDDRTVRSVASCGTIDTDWVKCGDPVSGILGTVIAERRTMRGDNPGGDPSQLQLPMRHPEVQTFLAAPVASPEHVYGWVCLIGNEGRSFTEDDEHLVRALSGQVGRIYENTHLYALAQKRAEELERQIVERRQAEDALRRSEQLNRNLLEHLPHRILVKDRNSVVLFCNASYAKDVGLPPEQVIGKDAFAFYPSHLAEVYNADDQEVMTSGLTKDMEEACLVDGETQWSHTVKVPYRDERGEVVGVLVVFEDITERKRLEDQYRQSQKLEAIGRLAGGVAHDFNNLLTGIMGYCELLLGDLEPGDTRRADIEEIQKAGTSAAALTRQLLAFSRKQIIEPTFLDLNVVVVGIEMLLARLIGEDVKVVLDRRLGLGLVEADRGQIEQIVLNLAVNARDAMPAGGTLTIETANVDLDESYSRTHHSVKPGPYVVLTVTDTGTGMTPQVRARLFEPFFTTKEPGKGTGLGLATVHGIVTQSGGSIDVSSEIGRGTSFMVYLPRAATEAVVAAVAVPADRPHGAGQTVLVVEDAEGLRELTRRLLERQGYKVLVAGNADEAERLFHQNASIEVLLTDVVMPGASGPELTRRLVEHRPGLKVVYMSGYTEEAIVHHGVLNPGISFVHKPFTSETLGRKIQGALDAAPGEPAGDASLEMISATALG